eukprot:955641-Amphidinium_carterae.1
MLWASRKQLDTPWMNRPAQALLLHLVWTVRVSEDETHEPGQIENATPPLEQSMLHDARTEPDG